jgi:Second Messenger Oligonucleotide or Dinucleotide Synthetase domain
MPFDYQPYFNRFITEVLPLDQTRNGRIVDAWNHLNELIANDDAFKRYLPQLALQGSYATGTAIRPVRAGDEFDVDVVLKVTLPALWSSEIALDWLRGRLALDGVFKKKLVEHQRCVRVSYAGDFHLDIVPARRASVTGPISGVPLPVRLKVPDRAGGWRLSNPEGFARWCRLQDNRTGGDFSRVVMMLKRWRDNNAPEKRRIRSIVFTTLIGRSVPKWVAPRTSSTRPDADVLLATLGALDRRLHTYSRVPTVKNPSLLSENLSRSWTNTDFLLFRKQIREAFRLAIAIRKSNDASAWRALFGTSFPTLPG